VFRGLCKHKIGKFRVHTEHGSCDICSGV
jgi:hypothetical protein